MKTFQINDIQVVGVLPCDLTNGDLLSIGSGMNSGDYTRTIKKVLGNGRFIVEVDRDFGDNEEYIELEEKVTIFVPAKGRILDWGKMPFLSQLAN